MVRRQLWQLSNCSISEYQNAEQLNDFLLKNRRQPASQRLIDPYEFYLRIAIITVLYQTQYAFESSYAFVMISYKIYYLFKEKIESLQFYDIIVILICSFIMPYLLKIVPFIDYLTRPIIVLYFLGAGSSRILAIPIQLTNSWLARIINLTLVSFDQMEQQRKNIVLVMWLDIFAFFFIGRYLNAVLILLIILIIQFFLIIDRTLLPYKRQFTHMYDLPAVKIYK